MGPPLIQGNYCLLFLALPCGAGGVRVASSLAVGCSLRDKVFDAEVVGLVGLG